MSLNLGTILQASAADRPEQVAVRLGPRAVRYAELDRAARGVAASLRARGIGPGASVAIMMPNVPEYTIAYFGVLYAGCTVVPLNVLLAAPEVAYHIRDSHAQLLIAHPLFRAPAEKGAARGGRADRLERRRRRRLPPRAREGGAAPRAPPDRARRHRGDPLHLGHDGQAEGRRAQPREPAPQLRGRRAAARARSPRRTSRSPRSRSSTRSGRPASRTRRSRRAGASRSCRASRPDDAAATIARDRVTLFAGVPTMYFALLHHAGAVDFSSVKWCLSGGAPMPVEVMKAFEAKFSVEILEGYGLSETSPVASFNMLGRPRKPGSIGYPVWGVELSIQDDAGQELPDGERGEICIRGHNVMKGYLGRPDATAETMRGGWFHSGDVGIRDADGSYRIVDRVKDLILRGGFNVYPREVEEVLYGHPADRGGGGDRHPAREPRRGGEGGDRAEARPERHARGPDRLDQGAPRRLQVPAHRRVRRRAPEGPDRQDPEARAEVTL